MQKARHHRTVVEIIEEVGTLRKVKPEGGDAWDVYYIGGNGRNDADYDNTLAENAESVPVPTVSKPINLALLALLLVVPGGLLVLAAYYIKEKLWR